jgi:L-lactate permease
MEANEPPALDPRIVIVEARRANQDSMMWQVPALVIAAQAFLFNVALSSSTRGLGRAIAAVVGLMLVLATLQRFSRHRQVELQNSKWLETNEASFKLPPLRPEKKRFWHWSSYAVWVVAFWGLALVDLGILGLAIAELAHGTHVLDAVQTTVVKR